MRRNFEKSVIAAVGVSACLLGCTSDPDPVAASSVPDGGAPTDGGTTASDAGTDSAQASAPLEPGKARVKLTFTNRVGTNLNGDSYESDPKQGSVNVASSAQGPVTGIGGNTKGVKAAQFTVFIGEVKEGASYDMEPGPIPRYYAGYQEIHELGQQSARWVTHENATQLAGKVTITSVSGKSFTFKVEGMNMGPANNANGGGVGTFTVEGTGEGVLP